MRLTMKMQRKLFRRLKNVSLRSLTFFYSKCKTQQTACLRSKQQLYKNRLAVRETESDTKIFVIGLKEAVVYVTTELDSIKASMNLAEENRLTETSETCVFYYDIPNEKIGKFLGNSKHLSRCLSKMDCKVSVAFKNNTKQIRVTCAKKSSTEALKHIQNTESKAVNKLLKFEKKRLKKTSLYLAVKYMTEIAVGNDVLLIERNESRLLEELNVLYENTLKPNSSTEQRFCWAGKYGKRLHVQRIGAEDLPCSHRILFYPNSKREREISGPAMTDFGLCTNIHLPEWIDGNSSEKQILRSLIATILNRAEQDKEDCLAMCLDPVEPWTSITFTSELTLEATNWMTNDSKWPKNVILFSLNDKHYENTIERAKYSLHKYAEDERRSRQKTITRVYEGELNAVEADVLVNTAASNLELKHGNVSAALLATAGNELQAECTNKYPRGIAKRQVAETKGYRLQCKKVYHITLEKNTGDDKKSMELYEDIRESMRLCMDLASNAGFKTIAFPALGTGTLKYPVDLVALAMFTSVEDFKRSCPNSTLERVMFVIYPKDTDVLEYFKHMASHLEKPDESNSDSRECEIIGLKTNVQDAESKIRDAIETAKKEQIVRHLKNVTEAQYCILLDFPDAQKATKSLENIQYDTERQVIILTGKCLEMENVLPILEKHLQNIQPLNRIELNMLEYSKSKINEHVMTLNEKYKDVKCVLHPTGNCLYIYGKKERLQETKDELLRRLNKEIFIPRWRPNSTTHHTYTSQETVQATRKNDVESDIVKLIETKTKVNTQSNKETGRSDITTDSNNSDSRLTDKIQDKECVLSQKDEKLSKDKKQQTVAGYLDENCDEKTISRVVQKSSRKLHEVDAQFYNVQKVDAPFFNVQEVDAPFYNVGGIILYAIVSNILDVHVDCIVNAANADLSHSGGEALKVLKAAGEAVQRECDEIISTSGSLAVGSVVRTTKGQLNCKLLLHAVGPRWGDYMPISEERLKQGMFDLKSTVVNCLFEANKYNMKSIALPVISSGFLSVPMELCAIQYAEAVIDFTKTPKVLERIYFVDINDEMINIMHHYLTAIFKNNQRPSFDFQNYLAPSSDKVVPSLRRKKNTCMGRPQNQTQTKPTEPRDGGTSTASTLKI